MLQQCRVDVIVARAHIVAEMPDFLDRAALICTADFNRSSFERARSFRCTITSSGELNAPDKQACRFRYTAMPRRRFTRDDGQE